MPASQATEAEPRVQPKFSFAAIAGSIILFAALLGADALLETLPDRQAAPPVVAALTLAPIEISAAQLAPLALVGAWRLTSPEPRVGGISGLAVDGEELVALTDSGVVLRFPKRVRPQMRVQVADLPAGPGDERFKINRDSEAILRDPEGRGWWIAFENREELWLFDPSFSRALKRIAVPSGELSENSGIEGLAGGGASILAFPEGGGSVLEYSEERWRQLRLDRSTPVADAVRIDDRSVLLVERRLTSAGFGSALALVRREGAMFRTVWRKRLPVGWRDNVEAVAAEPIAGGGHRLWIMTDNNFHPRQRTLLLIVDIAAAALPRP